MGWFTRRAVVDPVVETQGLVVKYDTKFQLWQFACEGMGFVATGAKISLPSPGVLTQLVADIRALMPEMRRRIEKGLEGWDGAKLDSGEDFSVDITDYQAEQTVSATWSDGSGWGDLAVEFEIKASAIVDESWGD